MLWAPCTPGRKFDPVLGDMGARQPKHASSDVHYGGAVGEQMMEVDGKLVTRHSRQHRVGIADERCQRVGILSRERGSVEIRSTESVRTECEGCTLRPRGAVSPGAVGARAACVEPWKETD